MAPRGHDHPDIVRTPDTAPPGPRVERRRRVQAGVSSLAGAVVGLVVGVGVAEVVAPHSGYLKVGLGLGLAVVGFFAAGLVAEARVATDVDVPVRDRQAAERGTAATDPRGQLPNSPVAPEHAPPRDTTSRLPSHRQLNDPESGHPPPGTEGRPADSDP